MEDIKKHIISQVGEENITKFASIINSSSDKEKTLKK